jgi:soluble lytic murein transglycosylase
VLVQGAQLGGVNVSRWFTFLCVGLFNTLSFGYASELPTEVGRLLYQKRHDAAQTLLDGELAKQDTTFDKNHLWAYKGFVAYDRRDLPAAADFFSRVAPRGSRLEEYVRLFQARIARENGDFGAAVQFFHQALAVTTTERLQFQIRFELAQTFLQMKEDRAAKTELEYMARKGRSDPHYPEVLWNLITVDKRLKSSLKICTRARELYAVHPAHPVVEGWGVLMRQNIHEGAKLDCEVSFHDIRTRLKRLQLSGLADKARAEIDQLRATSPAPTFELDELLASHLRSEGFASDALTILIKYAAQRSSDRNFLTTLGTTAARAGEHALAVGTYDRLAAISGGGGAAAFQAAFLSYRFQDYDGAERRFRQLLTRLPQRSAKHKEVVWYLAWIRYLRGDWKGSAELFTQILQKYKLPRDAERDFSWSKVAYWLGRSRLMLGEAEQAKSIFAQVADDRLRGYYALMAQGWLDVMNVPKSLRAKMVRNQDREIASVHSEFVATPDNVDEIAEESVVGDEPLASNDAGPALVTDFKDPRLAARLERAKELINLGQMEMAEWELKDIEKRTRNPEYLRTLMAYYQMVGGYHRASFIGGQSFIATRAKGYDAARAFWEAAYPKAFEKDVDTAARRVSFERDFIWSIMRAESHYRPTVFSGVGAIGLMQLMPYTAEKLTGPLDIKGFKRLDLLKPETNILLGSVYLDRLHRKFQGQLHLVAAGYNAGPHRVDDWLYSFGDLTGDEFVEHVPFAETRNYIKKVLRNYQIYGELYGKGGRSLAFMTERVPVRVTARPLGRETWD